MPIGHIGPIADVLPPPRTGSAGTPRLSLSLIHPDDSNAFHAEVLRIPRLPLVVGAAQPMAIPPRADLCLPRDRCKGLAPTHFCLFLLDQTPAILDIGSRIGTRVNGRWIGRQHARSHALLRAGWNTIMVGTGAESGSLWLGWEGQGTDS
jgi:hypothetical protein